jgi:hypothetical protein
MDIQQHCQNIINSPRIRNRIIVLCEGELPPTGRYSPSSYGKNDRLPDANFYKACLPRQWRDRLPVFFNSGSRSEVIKTYQCLRDIHDQNPSESRFIPSKIFALLDLDLQSENLHDYPFPSIDAVYEDLFTQHKINTHRLEQHQIWLTGFIHKEAYFLAPEIQEFFNRTQTCAYQDHPLLLSALYPRMAQDINNDQDMAIHWPRAAKRISHCEQLNLDCPQDFQQSWQTHWKTISHQPEQSQQLSYALLAIRKAKPYWENIHPCHESFTSDCGEEWRSFREDISLEIARQIYAEQAGHPHQHLACFFQYLYQLEQQHQLEIQS